MGTYGSGTYGSGTYGGRESAPPPEPGQGGSGYSWFTVEVTSEPVAEGPVSVGIFVRLPYEIEGQPTVTVGITRELPFQLLAQPNVTVGITRTLRYRVPPGLGQQRTTVGITRTLPYGVQSDVPEVEPTIEGGSRIISAGPLHRPEEPTEIRIPATLVFELPVFAQRIPGVASHSKAVEFRSPSEVQAVRPIELVVPGIRDEAHAWNFALADEEELIAVGFFD